MDNRHARGTALARRDVMTNASDGDHAGSERARDEARPDATPRVHGGPWKLADADPSDAESVTEVPVLVGLDPILSADVADADPAVESGAQHEGMGRRVHTGEKGDAAG